MRERIDTYQVGPAAVGQIGALVEGVIPDVLVEARKTANGRTISVNATYTKEGNDTIAHVFIEHDNEALRPFDLDKIRTVVTEHWTCGVFDSPIIPSL